ncbi:hypothetical protein Fmac_021276 [Flemingia macrophylla]|uniref:Uncharacterized protein n=1 Tax=Flemingia macrophylla TaxID=520843 RepID=A0ABD1LWJ4_9FABA
MNSKEEKSKKGQVEMLPPSLGQEKILKMGLAQQKLEKVNTKNRPLRNGCRAQTHYE